MGRNQRPDTVESPSVEPDGQTSIPLLLEELLRAAIPDLDRTGPVLAGRDRPFEVRVLERVILDVYGKMTLAAAKRNSFRHCPARQGAVSLEPKVVVKPSRRVALDDEAWLIPGGSGLPERLGRLARLPAPAVLAQAHLWIVA